jgi:hypothetical protein
MSQISPELPEQPTAMQRMQYIDACPHSGLLHCHITQGKGGGLPWSLGNARISSTSVDGGETRTNDFGDGHQRDQQ